MQPKFREETPKKGRRNNQMFQYSQYDMVRRTNQVLQCKKN
jgi:hypothetical protein